MKLFYGNFDFEAGLTGQAASAPAVRRIQAELATAWIAVAEEGDAIWCPEPVPPEFWEGLAAQGLPRVVAISLGDPVPRDAEFVPWGWNADAIAWARRQGLTPAPPPLDIVRAANSRRFSFAMEHETGTALTGSAECGTWDDLAARIRELGDARWVIKAQYSHAARERLLGAGPPNETAEHWVRKRIARDGAVYLEPWVERLAEVGVQWDLRAAEGPRLVGVTPLLCHSDGRYLGSLFRSAATEQWWDEAVDGTRPVAARLARDGYFGPLGIDAMLYRHGDAPRVRPIQDINARWTMGRLSLGWRRLPHQEPDGLWLHGEIPQDLANSRSRVLATTPAKVGGQPTIHCTTVLFPQGFPGETGFVPGFHCGTFPIRHDD